MPASDLVRYETSDHVATITLNRPERGNAWTGAMEVACRQALRWAAEDDDIGAIVLTGAGEQGTIAEAEARYHRRLGEMVGSADFTEGVAALTERRPPHFRP
jgi:enoyl-CoA hydratase/carnithine racemase